MSSHLLSDAWYQVASSRVALLDTVRAQPQRFRGQPWILLEDPYSHRFFRVTPQAYAFVRELTPEHTVDEIWRRLVQEHPQTVPGQDEVVRLLSQLHLSSLLYFREEPHSDAIFERVQKQQQRELLGKLLAFLYVRIPLFSPDRLLDSIHGLVMLATGRAAALVWLAVVAMGASTALSHHGAIAAGGEGLLSLANLPWMYLALTLVKVVHEAAHGFVCKRYGGHVPNFGVMLLVLAPMPYVDATASWGLRNKWQRAYVGAAGMLAELFLAGLAAPVWANTQDGLVHSMAFNVMVVGSVSSLLFNGNPLLRFDAYYILSDLAELPNLYQKAQGQWMYYGARWLLGQREGVEPASDATERVWYTLYGALAFAYRMTVTFGVLLYVTDQWFAVGIVMLGTTAVAMLLMPLSRLWGYLRSPMLRQGQRRAWLGLAGVGAALYAGLFWVPVPYAIRLPGVLEARHSTALFAQAPGTLVDLPVQHGQRVKTGELIARFDNPDLAAQIHITQLQQAETSAQISQALSQTPGEVAPLQVRLSALDDHLHELHVLQDSLTVRAAQDGEWVAPNLHERLGTWVERGQPVGELIDSSHFRFNAVLPQNLSAEVLNHGAGQASVRLAGDRGHALPVMALELVPFQRQRLMSPALGFSGGGDVAVRPDDNTGAQATESFFEVHAALAEADPPRNTAFHGMTGVLRVAVPARPLAQRWWQGLQQLLQRRYGA